MVNNIVEFHVTDASGRKRIKVKFLCSSCGSESETHKSNLEENSKPICRNCSNKKNGKIRQGKVSPKRGKKYKHLQGEKSKNWRGGRYVDTHGYVMVKISHGRPRDKVGWNQYKKEHVVVMEAHLNRKLKNDECVHHIDGNRQNNIITNLALIPTNQHHRITHHSLQKIGYELYKRGKLSFDRNKNEYLLIE